MENDINGLRSILFDTLERLSTNDIDTDQAKAISDTAQTIINSAKLEIEFARVTGKGMNTTFIPTEKVTTLPPAEEDIDAVVPQLTEVTKTSTGGTRIETPKGYVNKSRINMRK